MVLQYLRILPARCSEPVPEIAWDVASYQISIFYVIHFGLKVWWYPI